MHTPHRTGDAGAMPPVALSAVDSKDEALIALLREVQVVKSSLAALERAVHDAGLGAGVLR